MNHLINTRQFIEERETLPKSYIDINFTPTFALARDQQSRYFNFRSSLQTRKIGTSGFKSERKMLSKPIYSNFKVDEPKTPKYYLRGQSTKSSISNGQSKGSSVHPIQELSSRNTQDKLFLPFSKDIKDLNFDNFNHIKPLNPGFRGYKYSVLNTNRNLVKSKCLRRLA